jgi:very-short-patch-repair endonuclease
MASVLWAGTDCYVSHGAASVLWGFEGVRSPKVEIWVPRPRNPRSSLVVVHRGPPLEDLDRAELDSIPITTPTRTLIDVAGRLEDEALLTLLETCVRRDLVAISDLAERLDALRRSGRPGVGRLMELVASRPTGAAAIESRLEAKFWQLIASSDLPLPQRQFWVTTRAGARYRLDFAWPDRQVAVECDGRAFHDDATFESDERRRGELAGVGWLVVPVTWTQCARSETAVLDRVRGALRIAA